MLETRVQAEVCEKKLCCCIAAEWKRAARLRARFQLNGAIAE